MKQPDLRSVSLKLNAVILGAFLGATLMDLAGMHLLGVVVPLQRVLVTLLSLILLYCLARLPQTRRALCLPTYPYALLLGVLILQLLWYPVEARIWAPQLAIQEIREGHALARQGLGDWHVGTDEAPAIWPAVAWPTGPVVAAVDSITFSATPCTLTASVWTRHLRVTRPDSLAIRFTVQRPNGSFVQRASIRMLRPIAGESVVYDARRDTFVVAAPTSADTLAFRVCTEHGDREIEVLLWQPNANLLVD